MFPCYINAIALPVVGVLLITDAEMEYGPLDGGTEPAYPKYYFGSAFGITCIHYYQDHMRSWCFVLQYWYYKYKKYSMQSQ